MSNLSLFKQQTVPDQVASQLSRVEKNIAVVSFPTEENPRICQMNGEQIAKIIASIMMKAATRLGSKPKDLKEQQILNMELNGDLMKFPNLTEREIMKALENGLDGVYLKRPDDPVIFNLSNFVQWVRAYIEETKKPVMKKIAQLAHQVKDEEWSAPEHEQLKMSLEFFRNIMRRVLDGEIYEDYGNVVYNFLHRIGFMIVTDQDKWRAIDMAKLRILAEAKDGKDIAAQRNAIQKAMEMIARAETQKPDEAIISMAKRILVAQKNEAFVSMPEEEQGLMLEAIQDRVDSICAELQDSISKAIS